MNSTEPPEGNPSAALPHSNVRQCREDEAGAILAIINSAAGIYRDTIPADCWHEPYMSAAELQSELAAGVAFAGCEIDGVLAGVMGFQRAGNVDLIRHAYVSPAYQGHGIGSALIAHLRAQTDRTTLVGAWSAAEWAIRFYERHGFQRVPETAMALLLRTYWTISERQIETSVVLSAPHLTAEDAGRLAQAREATRATSAHPIGGK
jgi:GNAT superfamily N-acetyltransferase